MKKILFLLLSASAIAGHAQLRAVDKYIHEVYKQQYKVISVDTVAMPIRTLMSLDYMVASDISDAVQKSKNIPTGDIEIFYKQFETLLAEMEEEASTHAAAKLRIIEMESLNAPHDDDYYNYQRVKVRFNSGVEEYFFTRVGENEVSKTLRAYNKKKSDVFKSIDLYIGFLEKLKAIYAGE